MICSKSGFLQPSHGTGTLKAVYQRSYASYTFMFLFLLYFLLLRDRLFRTFLYITKGLPNWDSRYIVRLVGTFLYKTKGLSNWDSRNIVLRGVSNYTCKLLFFDIPSPEDILKYKFEIVIELIKVFAQSCLYIPFPGSWLKMNTIWDWSSNSSAK